MSLNSPIDRVTLRNRGKSIAQDIEYLTGHLNSENPDIRQGAKEGLETVILAATLAADHILGEDGKNRTLEEE